MKNLIHNKTLKNILGGLLTGVFSIQASAATNAAKLKQEKGSYTEMTSVFFVDKESANKKGSYNCDTTTLHIVAPNALFVSRSGRNNSETATIVFQMPGPNSEVNRFEEFKASVVGRDYFSSAALLKFADVRSVSDSVGKIKCTGMADHGDFNTVAGFKYHSLDYAAYNKTYASDRGLAGALLYKQNIDQSATGYYGVDYWSSLSASTLQPLSFPSLSEYVKRATRQDNYQSSKGLLHYMADKEAFMYKGNKDVFVMKPQSKNGAVEILGEPKELGYPSSVYVPKFSNVANYSRYNAFVGVKSTLSLAFDASNIVLYLERINGQPANTWSQAESIMTNYNNRTDQIIGYRAIIDGKPLEFLAGNKYLEVLSITRAIIASQKALGDNYREFTQDEKEVAKKAKPLLDQIFQQIYNNRRIDQINENNGATKTYFSNLGQIAQQLEEAFKDGDAYIFGSGSSSSWTMGPSQQVDHKTFEAMQKNIIALRKWISVEGSVVTRPTIQNQN